MRRLAQKLLAVAGFPLLPGLAAAADTAADEALYLQSLVHAGVLAYCSERMPGQASAYAEALAAWLQRNQEALARGGQSVRGQGGDGSAAAEARSRRRAERIIAEIRSLSPAGQQGRCEGLRREVGQSGPNAVPGGAAGSSGVAVSGRSMTFVRRDVGSATAARPFVPAAAAVGRR